MRSNYPSSERGPEHVAAVGERVGREPDAAGRSHRARKLPLPPSPVVDLPFEPEGEQVPATRRDLMADQQQDAVVPALPPLPAGFERVVIGEQQRAGTGGASVRQHFLHRGVTVGEGRGHVHHTREIVSAERIDGRAGGAIPKSTARVPARPQGSATTSGREKPT